MLLPISTVVVPRSGTTRSLRRLALLLIGCLIFLLLDGWYLFGTGGALRTKPWDSTEAEKDLVRLLIRTGDAIDKLTEVEDLAGYADKVIVLKDLSTLATNLSSAYPSMNASQSQLFSNTLEYHHDLLFAELFPYISPKVDKPRTLGQLRERYDRGAGILIPCGQDQFQYAVHLIATLKHVHHTPLPIQVVYAGNSDLPPDRRAALRSISPDVETLDVLHFFNEDDVGLVGGGWAIKVFAILASRFEEVIIVDADAVFLQDPEMLLREEGYVETGECFGLTSEPVTYKNTYGDKESFWMAFELAQIPYHFDPPFAALIGQLTHPDSKAHSIESRICSDHHFHLCPKGKPFWFNGSLRQEKRVINNGWFFATHWAYGTGDWRAEFEPWCMASIREKDVFRLSESPERFDLVLQHMIGTAMHWEAQFPQLIEKTGQRIEAYPNYNQSGNTGYPAQQPYGAPQQSGSPYPQPGGGAGTGSPYPPPAGQPSPYGAPSGYPQQNQAYGTPYPPQGQQPYASFPSPGAYGAPGAAAAPYPPQQGGPQGAYPPQYPQSQSPYPQGPPQASPYGQQHNQGPPQAQGGKTGEAASFYNPQAGGQQQQPQQQGGYGQGQPGGQAQAPYGQQQGQGDDRGLLGMAAAGGVAYMAYSAHSNSGNHSGKMFGAAHQAAGPGAASDPNYLLQILRQTVQEQKLGAFYGPGSLEQIAQKVVREQSLQRIAQHWQLPIEAAIDLVRLALFDIIIYADDSGSMRFEEGGKRIEELKMIVGRTAFAASFFDQDGIQIRFMNSKIEGASNTEAGAINIVNKVEYVYQTPLGTALQKKVLEPLVLGPAKHGQLRKPALIVIITDGEPSGEPHDKIVQVIKSANHDLAKTRYGPDAVSYQLAQVGNDQAARKFLESIDVNREIGNLVDVTSNYENEADNLRRARNPITLTPALWVIKLLLGGISSAYDFKDE
ncbi:hypothetical protein RQP46_010238 [Phenoliferia psychrophenolica]